MHPPHPPHAPAPGRLEIQMTIGNPLMWMLNFVTPTVQINRGPPMKFPWGVHHLDYPAAEYEVSAYFPWVFMSECGLARLRVPLWVGHTTVVRYATPAFFVFSPGSLTVVRHYPTPGMPQLPPA